MLATINFLISVCCSVSFHTTQFHVGNDRFSTPFPAFGHFYHSHFLPHWNGSVIGSAARLPQIMQCFQAKHRCVWCVWCVCCVWAWLVASEGNVCAQRSELIPQKSPTASPDKPSQHAAKPTLQRFFAVIIGTQYSHSILPGNLKAYLHFLN